MWWLEAHGHTSESEREGPQAAPSSNSTNNDRHERLMWGTETLGHADNNRTMEGGSTTQDVSVAQLVERKSHTLEVVGSKPTWNKVFLFFIFVVACSSSSSAPAPLPRCCCVGRLVGLSLSLAPSVALSPSRSRTPSSPSSSLAPLLGIMEVEQDWAELTLLCLLRVFNELSGTTAVARSYIPASLNGDCTRSIPN